MVAGLPGTEAYLRAAESGWAPAGGTMIVPREPEPTIYVPRAESIRHEPSWHEPVAGALRPLLGASIERVADEFPEHVGKRLTYASDRAERLVASRRLELAPHELVRVVPDESRARQVSEQYERMLQSLPPIRVRARTFHHAYEDERGQYFGPRCAARRIPQHSAHTATMHSNPEARVGWCRSGEPWVRLWERDDWDPAEYAEREGHLGYR